MGLGLTDYGQHHLDQVHDEGGDEVDKILGIILKALEFQEKVLPDTVSESS